MGAEKQQIHRPGAFKRANKPHKTGRHRSKGSINNEANGKVDLKTLSKHVRKELGKEARRHQSIQNRKKKREEIITEKRRLGSSTSPPILICVIPLQEDFSVNDVISMFTSADEATNVLVSPCGIIHMSIPRFKQRFSLIVPPVQNTFLAMDAAKVANTVLFVTSSGHDTVGNLQEPFMDSWGQEIVQFCLAQGLPNVIVALKGMESINFKKRQDCKQRLQKVVGTWLPDEKIYPLDKPVDAMNILRRAGSQKQRTVTYVNKRPHLLAEDVKFACNSDSDELGTLKITGYLRGLPLSVNNLVHVSGLGDFQMSEIAAPEDPYAISANKSEKNKISNEQVVRVLERADPAKQESLYGVNEPDPMDAEQTWPTEEELAEADASRGKKKIVKVVPKGTSEYQAAWIPDEDGENPSDYSDDENDDDMCVEGAMSQVDSAEENEECPDEEYENMTVSEAELLTDKRYDQEMDMEEELRAMEKLKVAKLDAQFPDEVDTPRNMLAKHRFQKYRGLESFRTSPWNVKENLPIDYARIFQFENFDRTRRRIFKESEDVQGAMPGWYITIHVANVKRELFSTFCLTDNCPLIVFGLFPNEHKMSLLNVVLKRSDHNAQPVKSKERLLFQCGFRRFTACPVFSQHTNGNKYKYERFFHPSGTVVASMYAPITFPPCPVLCYVEKRDGSLELIAAGNVLSVNPDRLIIKRVVLSGHPFKVHKRSAVVRFMFFNREDINWFKPVQLRTKYGRRGHIREPLGTHGHMKCLFDGQLKSQDTVLMNLYKRIFPKWTYEPHLLTQTPICDPISMSTEQC